MKSIKIAIFLCALPSIMQAMAYKYKDEGSLTFISNLIYRNEPYKISEWDQVDSEKNKIIHLLTKLRQRDEAKEATRQATGQATGYSKPIFYEVKLTLPDGSEDFVSELDEPSAPEPK